MTTAKNLAASIRERLRQRALADHRRFGAVHGEVVAEQGMDSMTDEARSHIEVDHVW